MKQNFIQEYELKRWEEKRGTQNTWTGVWLVISFIITLFPLEQSIGNGPASVAKVATWITFFAMLFGSAVLSFQTDDTAAAPDLVDHKGDEISGQNIQHSTSQLTSKFHKPTTPTPSKTSSSPVKSLSTPLKFLSSPSKIYTPIATKSTNYQHSDQDADVWANIERLQSPPSNNHSSAVTTLNSNRVSEVSPVARVFRSPPQQARTSNAMSPMSVADKLSGVGNKVEEEVEGDFPMLTDGTRRIEELLQLHLREMVKKFDRVANELSEGISDYREQLRKVLLLNEPILDLGEGKAKLSLANCLDQLSKADLVEDYKFLYSIFCIRGEGFGSAKEQAVKRVRALAGNDPHSRIDFSDTVARGGGFARGAADWDRGAGMWGSKNPRQRGTSARGPPLEDIWMNVFLHLCKWGWKSREDYSRPLRDGHSHQMRHDKVTKMYFDDESLVPEPGDNPVVGIVRSDIQGHVHFDVVAVNERRDRRGVTKIFRLEHNAHNCPRSMVLLLIKGLDESLPKQLSHHGSKERRRVLNEFEKATVGLFDCKVDEFQRRLGN